MLAGLVSEVWEAITFGMDGSWAIRFLAYFLVRRIFSPIYFSNLKLYNNEKNLPYVGKRE